MMGISVGVRSGSVMISGIVVGRAAVGMGSLVDSEKTSLVSLSVATAVEELGLSRVSVTVSMTVSVTCPHVGMVGVSVGVPGVSVELPGVTVGMLGVSGLTGVLLAPGGTPVVVSLP